MGEYVDELVKRFMFPDYERRLFKSQRRGHAAPKGSALARARRKAHISFDAIWQGGYMNRSQAKRWLARQMRLHPADCHIIFFGIDRCSEVVRICDAYKPEVPPLE